MSQLLKAMRKSGHASAADEARLRTDDSERSRLFRQLDHRLVPEMYAWERQSRRKLPLDVLRQWAALEAPFYQRREWARWLCAWREELASQKGRES